MDTINQKLVMVQSQLKAPKGQFNKFGNYKYRSCEDIIESAKPILAELKLSLRINDELVMIGDRYYVKATAGLYDDTTSITAIAYAREAENKKGMDESQITGATSSYARKYALNGLLAIDDTQDADTMDNTQHLNKIEFPQKYVVKAGNLNVFGNCPDCGLPLAKSQYGDNFYCTGYIAGCKFKKSIADKKPVEEFVSKPGGKVVGELPPINIDEIPF